MQVDGYSLDAQKTKLKSFCEFNDYEIAGEYEDAGISGKSIENRIEFNRMMNDIKTGKDDVSDHDAELETLGKQLRQQNSRRDIILADIDNLDVDDKHYASRKTDLENSLYKVYDKIDEVESLIIETRAKKRTVISDKMSVDNIYKSIIYLDKFFDKMNPQERRDFVEQLVGEVQVFPERTAQGQWLKSIKFKLPLLDQDMGISLYKHNHDE